MNLQIIIAHTSLVALVIGILWLVCLEMRGQWKTALYRLTLVVAWLLLMFLLLWSLITVTDYWKI